MENTTLNFGGGKRQRGGDWAGSFKDQAELDLWTQLNTNELFVGLRATLPSGPVTWRGASVGWVQLIARRRIVSSLGGYRFAGVAKSNGTTQVSGTDIVPFTVFGPSSGIKALLVNGYAGTSGLIGATGNDITVKVSLDVAPQCLPFHFEGDTSAGSVIKNSGFAESKPLMVGLSRGNTYYVRTYKAVPSGQFWPYTYSFPSGSTTTDLVNGVSAGSGVDITANYNGAAVPGDIYKPAYFPVALIGNLLSSFTVYQLQGDSIANGSGANLGYLQTAVNSIPNSGYHTDAIAGSALSNVNKYDEIAAYLSQYVDVVVLHSATNDLANSIITTLQGYKDQIELFMLRNSPNAMFRICTILPRTTSTDSWATVANQSTQSFEALRVDINNWLRSSLTSWAQGKGYTAKIIDACVGYEKNSDGSTMTLSAGQQVAGTGGRHPASCTADGIHPNDTGVAILAPIAATSIRA